MHTLQSLLLCNSHHSPDLNWDKLVIAADLPAVKSHFCNSFNTARLLAVSAPHSGDWLHALSLATCSLKLDNKAIRIAIGLRLGVNLCDPRQCPCGKLVDARGTHGPSCRCGAARTIRHLQLNDIISRALVRANIPSVLEPTGLSRSDGKRSDGMTLIPWQGGKNVIWDVTVTDTIADFYLHLSTACAGSAAEGAASRKEMKYTALDYSYTFIPLAFETYRPINNKGIKFVQELGRRLRTISDDPRELVYLQRICITLQHFNAITFSDTFTLASETE